MHISRNLKRLAAIAVMALLASCATVPATTTTTGTATTGTTGTYSSYTIPTWAPTSANLSNTRYYYFPDLSLFYDAGTGQYISQVNGTWSASSTLPASLTGTDLNNSFVVLLGPNAAQPWQNYSYYQTNYPTSYYQSYPDIVTSHNLISGLPAGYSAVPRAYDENSDQVIFLERDANGNFVSGTSAYNTVPMSSIGTYMPADSRSYNYGAGIHHQ